MESGKLFALDPILFDQYEDMIHKKSNFLDHLYKLITQSIEPPFSLSIDGLWGTGKTTLMKILEIKLKDTYPTFWFNPWEYRQTENVTLAFLQSLAAKHKDIIDKLQRSGGKIFKVLLNAGIGTALNLITQGNVSLKDIKADLREIETDQKMSFESFQNSIETVKEEFKELIERISANHSNRPVIIFFDDLDRCLPENAIQLLEALKNFFVTPRCKCIFICGIDTRVAKQFISKYYNELPETFAIDYFRKIFNLTISMPFGSNINELLAEYIKKLYGISFKLTEQSLKSLKDAGVIDSVLTNLKKLENQWYATEKEFITALEKVISSDEIVQYKSEILKHSEKPSPSEIIYNAGNQADISSVRKYLNIINNFYIFEKFNPKCTSVIEAECVIHFLVMKESWQPMYELLVRKAYRENLKTMKDLIDDFLKSTEYAFSEKQKSFLTLYFINEYSSFSELSKKTSMANFFSTYSTLT